VQYRTLGGPGPVAWPGLVTVLLPSGAPTGARLPAASAKYLAERSDVRRAAGRVYEADHLGAMAGAQMTGARLAPPGGLAGTAITVAIAKSVPLLSLFTHISSAMPDRRSP